nr:PglZ domain-containing protein [Anaerolineaceae bacterium]
THQFLERVFRKYWDPKGSQKAYILVFDGMRTDAWKMFLRPIFETRYKVEKEFPGSAILPTETNLSRKAISAGRLPDAFQYESKRESTLLENWLKKNLSYKVKFEVIKDDDATNSGMAIWYRSEKLDYIVFNFTDENLHHNEQELSFIYDNTVNQIIREDVQAVLREIPDNATIFITSDHGFTTLPDGQLQVPNSVATPQDTKYRCVRAQQRYTEKEENVTTFVADQMHIPTHSLDRNAPDFRYVLFPRPNLLFKRASGRHAPDRYSHGGLTMAECLIPMVVIIGKEQKQSLFRLDSVKQVNIARENEPVELEIMVSSSQIFVQDTLLTFDFNAKNLPPHREIISTTKKRITIQWIPDLPNITKERRQKGIIEIPLVVKMSYQEKKQEVVVAYPVSVRVRINQDKLRRKLDSKLDLMMGKIPKTMRS